MFWDHGCVTLTELLDWTCQGPAAHLSLSFCFLLLLLLCVSYQYPVCLSLVMCVFLGVAGLSCYNLHTCISSINQNTAVYLPLSLESLPDSASSLNIPCLVFCLCLTFSLSVPQVHSSLLSLFVWQPATSPAHSACPAPPLSPGSTHLTSASLFLNKCVFSKPEFCFKDY